MKCWKCNRILGTGDGDANGLCSQCQREIAGKEYFPFLEPLEPEMIFECPWCHGTINLKVSPVVLKTSSGSTGVPA